MGRDIQLVWIGHDQIREKIGENYSQYSVNKSINKGCTESKMASSGKMNLRVVNHWLAQEPLSNDSEETKREKPFLMQMSQVSFAFMGSFLSFYSNYHL